MARGAAARLKSICMALPEAVDDPFGGHTAPAYRVRGKIFAMVAGDRDGSERVGVWCKAEPGAQEILVGFDPRRFFRPPYLGPKGWVGVYLDVPDVDWAVVEDLLRESYRLIAPRKLVATLDAAGAGPRAKIRSNTT
jgi:predicted DNA-binding protein (MmcQ/YjbR family)